LGKLSKSPRRQLTDFGLDSPSPTKYDAARGSDVLKPNRGNYSFGKPHLKILDHETGLSHSLSTMNPGPGDYHPKHLEMGTEGPRYSIDKQKAGYSYLNYEVLKHPPVNKYDPKPTYLKTHLIKDGLGVMRGERDYSYILNLKTPGPGGYDLSKEHAHLPNKFIHGKIDPDYKNSSLTPKIHTPGPGHYEVVKPLLEKHNWDQQRLKAENFRELRRPNLFGKNL